MDAKKFPVNLKVDIDHAGLKKILEEGRLMEFVCAFSSLAKEHIQAQLIDHIAQTAAGAREVNNDISFTLGFDDEPGYGTRPHHWPWPWGIGNLEEEINQVLKTVATTSATSAAPE